jgi:glycerol uptake facilitator-like aquaporin
MGVATDDCAPAGVAPFALAATVSAGALVTGPLTGGSFNPARSLGPALGGGGWVAHWLYWAAPIGDDGRDAPLRALSLGERTGGSPRYPARR